MKVYKSQTQATDEPGNIQFGIRQNPSLSSAGSIAKANFGNTVQQVGNQMGQIAIKVQEIKNATEVSRVKNEYTKINSEISSFVPHAPHFFDVATWSEKERNNFDLVSYLKFFKSFFIKLTFYSTLIFAVTYFLYDEEIAAIAWCLSLTVPWPYFIIKSQKYSK